MSSSDVLSQTLHSLTSIKLEQISKQKHAYEAAKAALLSDCTGHEHSKRLHILLDGAVKLPSMTPIVNFPSLEISSIREFLEQAECDPSVSISSLNSIENTIRKEIDVHTEKYRFAELYGRLVKEWISSSTAHATNQGGDDSGPPIAAGRTEAHDQRAIWEEYVFDPLPVDTNKIKKYLSTLFSDGSEPVARAFAEIGKSLAGFQENWDGRTHFNPETLKETIRGLLRSNLLNDAKRTALAGFLDNAAAQQEISDVLNMRMKARHTWSWDSEFPCVIEQRRSLNGRYRFYPDEDLLQSIFLYYIGSQWAVRLRKELMDFAASPRVWQEAHEPVTREERRRREYFLDSNGETPQSVHATLHDHFWEEILLNQLPKSTDERRAGYEDEKDDTQNDNRKSPIQVVQKLIHILQASVVMRRCLGKETAIVRSDFKWFGPSLPHDSIIAVLETFGVRSSWIEFFRKTLECPLRFENDPVDSGARVRKRGVSLSTPLADVFSETLLFCLDFAVNQKAEGVTLYRLHDDMWLFDTIDGVSKAWEVITEFSSLFGLSLNEEKTGSAVVRPRNAVRQFSTAVDKLPFGDVSWGFLVFDSDRGRFTLSQPKISDHIAELRLQLAACTNVFDWIRAWNTYGVRFFTTNFGAFGNCLGREHSDEVLAAFSRVSEELFSKNGSVTTELKGLLRDRFGVEDVPDGFLFYPVELGGLGLKNPFIEPLIARVDLCKSPEAIVDNCIDDMRFSYEEARDKWNADEASSDENWQSKYENPIYKELHDEPFMTFEEFARHPEKLSPQLTDAFGRLLGVPDQEVRVSRYTREWGSVKFTGMEDAREAMTPAKNDTAKAHDWWIVHQYASEVLERFGRVTIIEKGLLPLGFLDMLQRSRFKWQQ